MPPALDAVRLALYPLTGERAGRNPGFFITAGGYAGFCITACFSIKT